MAIPKYNSDGDVDDIFGALTLNFPFEPETEDLHISSTQVLAWIRSRLVKNKSSGEGYNYYNGEKNLDVFCLGDSDIEYYIPLFLLLGNASDTRKLRKIIDDIAQKNVELICMHCQKMIRSGRYGDFIEIADEIIIDKSSLKELKNIDNEDIDSIDIKLNEILQEQGCNWAENMQKYLNSCVSSININEIVVAESNRARGIDIYENLNIGGVKLSVFDLLIARAAKTSKDSLTERIRKNIEKERAYNYLDYISEARIKNEFNRYVKNNTYSTSKIMECYKNDVPVSVYTDTFMNVLSLIVNGEGFKNQEFKVDQLKRKQILLLTSEDINDNCDLVCDSIDRALFFLHSRCGIRKISDINYSLMLTILAYILSFKECYTSSEFYKVLNVLEGWYWSSVFSGKYDKDQNLTMIRDLKNLLDNAIDIVNKNGKDFNIAWMNERVESTLECQGFSNKEFIVCGDKESNIYPKVFLSDVICQYYLSRAYFDLKNDNPDVISVFSPEAKKLEKHHVIPLGAQTIKDSTDKLRNNKTSYLNLPMNFVYITSDANKEISAKSLSEYSSMLPNYSSVNNLGFSNVNIDASSSDNEKIDALKTRFDNFKAKLLSDINALIKVNV